MQRRLLNLLPKDHVAKQGPIKRPAAAKPKAGSEMKRPCAATKKPAASDSAGPSRLHFLTAGFPIQAATSLDPLPTISFNTGDGDDQSQERSMED
jgi:hypothetical protein